MLYAYVKNPPARPGARRSLKIPLVLILSGLVLGILVGWPLFLWQVYYKAGFENHKDWAIPTPKESILGVQANFSDSGSTSGTTVERDSDGFSYFHREASQSAKPYSQFSLTIPRLQVEGAKVVVFTNDFSKNLALLPGTSLPGTIGNVFITGHSALPAFSSPTDYKSIFTELPKLEFGDEVSVKTETGEYRYLVEKTIVVDPDNVSVIAPPDPFGYYLTLMTCVPPGLSTQRLVVRARLSQTL